jgi:hypothetical protein
VPSVAPDSAAAENTAAAAAAAADAPEAAADAEETAWTGLMRGAAAAAAAADAPEAAADAGETARAGTDGTGRPGGACKSAATLLFAAPLPPAAVTGGLNRRQRHKTAGTA